MFGSGSIRAAMVAIGLSTFGLFCLAPSASANLLFWLEPDDGRIMSMPLNGSAAPTELNVAPAVVDSDSQSLDPGSLDYDPETGRLYWTNSDNPANISWAAADGSGGGLLTTTVPTPLRGLSLDTDGGKLYVRSGHGESISTIGLDGVAGTWALNDDEFRGGPLVDLQSGTLWAAGSEWVSYGNLDGSGSLDTYMPSTFMNGGLSVDRDAGRLYGTWWPGPGGGEDLAWMATDESDDGALTPTGVDIVGAASTAIDHDTGEIYWTNAFPYGELADTRGLFKVSLSGGAGSQVGSEEIGGRSGGLLILKTPSPVGEPELTGDTTVGSTLTCGDISWAGDRQEAHYFRSPVTRQVAWSYNGLPIAGANGETLVADKAGTYRCARAGTNAAGSAAELSNEIVVTDPPHVCPAIKLSVQISKFSPPRPFGRQNAPGVRINIRSGRALEVSLQPKITFHGKEGKRVGTLRNHQIRVNGRKWVRFLLPGKLRRAIAKQRGRVRFAPVTFSARATLWQPGNRDCAQRQNLKLKTKVVNVSTRVGLRRLW